VELTVCWGKKVSTACVILSVKSEVKFSTDPSGEATF
jgi:hypothetical protein